MTRRRDDRRGRAANELKSFRFGLIKVPAALLTICSFTRVFTQKTLAYWSPIYIGKPDMFEPDITVEVESEDRKSAFSVMIEKIGLLTDLCKL